MQTKSKRLTAILLVGIALICAAAVYEHFFGSQPIGHGPAGPAVSRAAFSHPWTDGPVLPVGLGDSVTAGFGARKGYSYFDRLIANPSDEFEDMREICLSAVMPKLQTTNLSVSGTTSSEHVEGQLPRLASADSNVFGIAVITTGGNDLIHNYGKSPPREQAMYGANWEEAQPWIARFERRLETMVSQIEARFPGGCHIFLADIYDPTDGVGDIQCAGLPPWKDGLKILDAYNEVIRRCAEKRPRVHLIRLHTAFLGHGIHSTQFWSKHYSFKDPHYWFYGNLEDPNERGYDAIRRLFLIEMAKAFGHSTSSATAAPP